MPKIKVPKKSPSLDMTPMVIWPFAGNIFYVDHKFRPEEPVVVDMPSSVSSKILPENTLTITVDSAGKGIL